MRFDSSVDSYDPRGWLVLCNAMMHLANRLMDGGDTQAWWVMSDLKNSLFNEPPKRQPHGCMPAAARMQP